ncbi:hypothetical protein [Streptacidiphilus sp. EB129]|jgi:hypothetical protein|uniref:hypothetical protein n=1 Tax=Streptacidiphilus sp. EB129 TaxID=3156262 RepID=UPI003516CC4C
MPQLIDRLETESAGDEFDLDSLDLSALTVVSMVHGTPAADGATVDYAPSCCCNSCIHPDY